MTRVGSAPDPGWSFTDDSRDPCALCVQWDEPDDDDPMCELVRPIWPDGSTVERVYRFTHTRHLAAAMASA